MRNTKLPPDLQAAWDEIDRYAREYGLDYFPISYEVLDYRTLYEVAAFDGFPTRYPHWRFGMAFDQLIKGHTYGLSIIYEMVINNNPSYAYLLEGNDMTTQKMVMAHVTGHVDFFKNNLWFSHTNRHMLDAMANHAVRIQKLIDRYGYEPVEDFVDTCLSLENLIDYHAPYIRRADAQTIVPVTEEEAAEETPEGLKVDRQYMKGYINPPEFIEEQRQRLEDDRNRSRNFPESPQKDILLFLLNYAPLERWQHTVLDIVRDEAYYFAPQAMTKVINEGWACVVSGSLLFTSNGVRNIKSIVDERRALQVSDGVAEQRIYDWVTFEDYPTIRIRTRRGFELEGSFNHRVLLPGESWRRLDDLYAGARVLIRGGNNLWAKEQVVLDWHPTMRPTLRTVADRAGVSIWTVMRFRQGERTRHAAVLAPLVAEYEAANAVLGPPMSRRKPIKVPTVVDERLAMFLGYLVGDGHISAVKRTIGLTTGDEEQAETFVQLVQDLFGLYVHRRWDPNRWRLSFSSLDVQDFLKHLGLKLGVAARIKDVPDVILRSPGSVVAAFLRALYDCDGYAGNAGVILSTSSESMGKTVQVLLLNFGILSTRRRQQDGCWHVHIMGQSAEVFRDEIGFGLRRKRDKLRAYVEERRWFKREDWTDEIVSIEHGRADVYDISVEETHRYAAQGFINHNSFWHSEIMTKKAARASEIVDFAEHHSGVVATSPQRMNPYKLGLELLRDIEERWNKGKFGKEYDDCDNFSAKRAWDRQLGLGRQKIFEVRRFHNDITFIDEFLTPEFALEQKLFTFRYNRDTDLYEIASREFEQIKRQLLYRLTNFGQPFIYVEDGNYANRGELYLRHRHEGVDLRIDYARDTMRNLHKIWKRPVHLETIVDEKKRLLSFDGRDYSERRID
jgi:stage V sporulation protein R